MQTSYGSSRYNITVGTMIIEILNWIINGVMSLIMFSTLAFLNTRSGYDNFLSILDKKQLDYMEHTFNSVGVSLEEGIIAVVISIALFAFLIALFAFIAFIISIVSIRKAKKEKVSFTGDAIFKIVTSIIPGILCLLLLFNGDIGIFIILLLPSLILAVMSIITLFLDYGNSKKITIEDFD